MNRIGSCVEYKTRCWRILTIFISYLRSLLRQDLILQVIAPPSVGRGSSTRTLLLGNRLSVGGVIGELPLQRNSLLTLSIMTGGGGVGGRFSQSGLGVLEHHSPSLAWAEPAQTCWEENRASNSCVSYFVSSLRVSVQLEDVCRRDVTWDLVVFALSCEMLVNDVILLHLEGCSKNHNKSSSKLLYCLVFPE